MNDLILSSYLNDFVSRFGHADLKESLQFEYFVAHCLVAKNYQGHFDVTDLSLGEENGIDSIAIFLNGVLLESVSEIASLSKQNIDVRFVFIQTKTSNSYDQGDVLKFTHAVRQFFQGEKKNVGPLVQWMEMKDEIYKNAIRFSENPKIELYYATTSNAQPNELISNTQNNETKILEELNLFSDVNFKFVDAEGLKSIYRTLSNKITKQINFEKFTILPKIHGVKRAFIGILPCIEYLKLIRDEQGKLLKNVFYDNVRDFQGNNSVNQEILTTITGEDFGREIFVLLNNGVTVVSKSVNPVGSDFTVKDFQVVNGCQTSHVLHQNANLLSGKEFITIKLIETEDVDLTNKITKATNRQTEVKLEAFAGLQPFHKELEAFYASIPVENRLYYERRPGQYDFDSSISHNKIISIPNQIKSFVSVFLEEPESIHFYYGDLLKNYSSGDESVLFSEGHDAYPYYVASLLNFRVLEKLRQRKSIEKKWRYHLSTMVRMLISGPFNRNKLNDTIHCKRYCESVINNLPKFDSYYSFALDTLNAQLTSNKKITRHDRDLNQDRNFVQTLLSICRNEFFKASGKSDSLPTTAIENSNGVFIGYIKKIVAEKNFGFIEYGQRQFFFRFRNNELSVNDKVRFKLKKKFDATEAIEVVRF